jgi:hypothetical protein
METVCRCYRLCSAQKLLFNGGKQKMSTKEKFEIYSEFENKCQHCD